MHFDAQNFLGCRVANIIRVNALSMTIDEIMVNLAKLSKSSYSQHLNCKISQGGMLTKCDHMHSQCGSNGVNFAPEIKRKPNIIRFSPYVAIFHGHIQMKTKKKKKKKQKKRSSSHFGGTLPRSVLFFTIFVMNNKNRKKGLYRILCDFSPPIKKLIKRSLPLSVGEGALNSP